MHGRARLAAVIGLALLAPVRGADAQATRTEEFLGAQRTHYAYSTLFGTGFYTLDDREVAILRLPIRYVARQPEPGGRPGVNVLLPVTLGIENFNLNLEFDEVLDLNINDLAIATFVPGIELVYDLNPRWRVRPSGYYGFGRDLSGGESSAIFGTRVTSLYRFDREAPRFSFGTELLWSGYKANNDTARFLTRIGAGLNGEWPVDWEIGKGTVYVGSQLITYFYLDEAEFQTVGDQPIGIREEFQIGISLGRNPPFKLFGLEFRELGVGYQFGKEIDAIVFYSRFPF